VKEKGSKDIMINCQKRRRKVQGYDGSLTGEKEKDSKDTVSLCQETRNVQRELMIL